MEPMALRPYQEEALDRVERAAARGVRRQLGVAATGLGKAQPDLPVGCTKGDASDLLGAHLARLRARKRTPAAQAD